MQTPQMRESIRPIRQEVQGHRRPGPREMALAPMVERPIVLGGIEPARCAARLKAKESWRSFEHRCGYAELCRLDRGRDAAGTAADHEQPSIGSRRDLAALYGAIDKQ